MKRIPRRAVPLLLFAAAPLALGACMGYPAQVPPGQETAPTMAAPESSGESRLPGLLSQLQTGTTGLELFDGSQSDVLAAQDTQDKGDGAGGTPTVAVTATPRTQPTATRTPAGSLPLAQPTATPTPAGTPSSSPSPTTEAAPTVTPSPTVAPTSTPVPTLAPGATPPTEGGASPTQAPPTEG